MSIRLRFPFFVVLCLGLSFGALAQDASLSELEQQAIAAAEAKYPLYHEGESIVITFARDKGSRVSYHGVYRILSPTRIQIGKNYVTLADLPEEIRARFDAELNARMRDEEINNFLWKENVSRSSSSIPAPSPLESPAASDEAEAPLDYPQNAGASGDRDAATAARQTAEDTMNRADEVRARDLAPALCLDARSNWEWGRNAFRARDFEKATEFYGEAERLYRQAIEEGRQKLERDAATALAQEEWQTVRDIANWMDKFDPARGAEMLRQADQTESDTHYSRGEAALARGDWTVARQFADLLYFLDKERCMELKRRANRGEADALIGRIEQEIQRKNWSGARNFSKQLQAFFPNESTAMLAKVDRAEADDAAARVRRAIQQKEWTGARQNCRRLKELFAKEGDALFAEINRAEADDAAARVRRAIQQNDWTGARQNCKRLKELFPGEEAEMVREVDRAEVAYCIGQAKKAIKDHEWSKARTHIQRVTVIEPHNAEASKLLAKTDQGEEDELYNEATQALRAKNWQLLSQKAHALAGLNAARAKPFLEQLSKHEEEERKRLAKEAEQNRAKARKLLGISSGNSGRHSADISSVMSSFNHNDIMADSALHQQVNGAYRMVDLLMIMAKQCGCSSSEISRIQSDFSHNDIMADSALHQITNGTYRTVELLCLIASKIGCSSSEISQIKSNFSHNDIMADSALHQITNGTYRTVELLCLIAAKVGCSSSEISRIKSDFSHNDIMANSAPQQIVNGTYRTEELLCLIATKIGCSPSEISKIQSDFRHGDIMADNANQQIVTGFYNSVQLLKLIVQTLD